LIPRPASRGVVRWWRQRGGGGGWDTLRQGKSSIRFSSAATKRAPPPGSHAAEFPPGINRRVSIKSPGLVPQQTNGDATPVTGTAPWTPHCGHMVPDTMSPSLSLSVSLSLSLSTASLSLSPLVPLFHLSEFPVHELTRESESESGAARAFQLPPGPHKPQYLYPPLSLSLAAADCHVS